MKRGINSQGLPHHKRVERHENYNKPTAEVLAAADKAILIQKLKDSLKNGSTVPMSVIAALNDQDYKELSGLVDALIARNLIEFGK
ncbi:MAG: hypothetical protein N4J56_001771 [Chroococcidiopsis sp. SAG 2025]|uniref:hypothetical protein n=1 Tax=Chroococcidiopsis sp. SAG 2025 TaxID=171389 RepID=UPI002936DC9B|nr:hypothetical protein [Chroococcidiopsis sp. SAG 2025]MDV2992117.1 hypothetical protein [Chroococcidiopsis sp. SAG 2025]